MQERHSIDSKLAGIVESTSATTQDALRAARYALAAVQAAQDALDHKDSSQIKFLSTIGHEMRVPLASILGYVQILQQELDPSLTRHHREFFKTILTNVKLSLQLVSDLSSFAQMDIGELDVDVKTVPLHDLLSDTVNQLHPFAEEKGILLSADLPMEEYYVQADEDLLRKAIHNLVSYAIRYTDDGSVTVHVVPAVSPTQETYTVEIMDTGRGIREDILDRAQTIPVREKRLAYLMEEGVSISLSLALEYILTMRGTIDVKSDLGQGSVFLLTFERALLPALEKSFL